MITTVNCHSSFLFPPQHTLRARGVCSRIPHPGVCPPQHVPLLGPCLCSYYTIFGNPWVTPFGRSDGLGRRTEDRGGTREAPDAAILCPLSFVVSPLCYSPLATWRSSCGRRSGKKSIWRARASFAAVRKEKLTSWWSTFVMYGRDTCMRFASSDCDTPSSFIRRRMRRRNAEPILSIAVNGICRVVSFNAEALRR